MKHLYNIVLSIALVTPSCPALASSTAFPLCSYAKRTQCVVDGDTFWKDGQKHRLKGIDAPSSVSAKCQHEYQIGVAAAYQLQKMLESGIISMKSFGADRYGRTLVTIETNMGDIGSALLDANLVQSYARAAARTSWC